MLKTSFIILFLVLFVLSGCTSRESIHIPPEEIALSVKDVGKEYSSILERRDTLATLKKDKAFDRGALKSLFLNGFIESYQRIFQKNKVEAGYPKGITEIGCLVSLYKTSEGALRRWQMMPVLSEGRSVRIKEMGGRTFGERSTYFWQVNKIPDTAVIKEEIYVLVFIYKNYKVSVSVQGGRGEVRQEDLYPYAVILEGRLKSAFEKKQ